MQRLSGLLLLLEIDMFRKRAVVSTENAGCQGPAVSVVSRKKLGKEICNLARRELLIQMLKIIVLVIQTIRLSRGCCLSN